MKRWRRVRGAPAAYPRELQHEHTLLDGREVFLRPILPSDEPALRRAVATADPETLRMRFLGGRPPETDEEFYRLVHVDYDRRLAVCAFDPSGEGVGIGRYEVVDGDAAEVSVAVDPAWRHVGLAGELVLTLGRAAQEHGITRFRAEFFADNVDVADLFAEAGLPYQRKQDDARVVSAEVTLPVPDAP